MVRTIFHKQKGRIASAVALVALLTVGSVSHADQAGNKFTLVQVGVDERIFSSKTDAATFRGPQRAADWQVSFSPRDNASEVSVDSPLQITFDKPVRLTNKKELSDSAIQNIIKLTNSKKRKVAFSAKWEAAARTIKIKPNGNLENDMTYTISLIENKLIDAYGNKNPQVTSRFTTKKMEDRIPPTATIAPAHGAVNVKLDEKITIQFAENVVLADGTPLSSKAVANLAQLVDEKGAAVAHTATWNKSKRTITLKVKGKMLKNSWYTVTFPTNRVKDMAGNGNQSFSASFLTRSK